jgi:hypothetical protein
VEQSIRLDFRRRKLAIRSLVTTFGCKSRIPMNRNHNAVGFCLGAIALLNAALTHSTTAADVPADGKPAVAAAPPLTKTVGVNIVKKTVNPDKSWTLEFQWKDKDQKTLSRSVIVNGGTVIGVDGRLQTLADITDDVLKKKAVATVGPDNVTAVNLRFGRAMIVVSKDRLTPAQIAALESAAPKTTAASVAALEKRVAEIVAALQLNDAAKESRVREILTIDLRTVRDSHNAGFAPAQSVRVNLNRGLEAELTAEQVETVKNKLTVNKVPVTLKAYHQILPDLTAEEDSKIQELLKQAREDCLDVKNPDEMARIFKPYKTQIETYLIAQGHDWRMLYQKFVDSQKGN